MGAAAALIAALLGITGPAKPTTPSGTGETVPAILTVSVNTTDAGESLVILRDSGRDVLVPPSVLSAAGLKTPTLTPVTVEGRSYVSLAAITPKLKFEVDESALTLRIMAPPELFGLQRIDLHPREPEGTTHLSSAALFANYGLNWSGDRRPTLSTELGASLGPALLLSTMSRSVDGVVTRGLTTLTIDKASSMVRFSGGDIAMRGGPLWSSGVVAGAGVSREFSLNPYFIRFPTPRLTQTLSTPSTVDVYVNDRLVRRSELAPGVFDITGIPALAGAGNTRVVVRDGFGRTQSFDTSYYVTSAVLAKGLHDFQYAVGSRQRYALDGGDHRQSATMTHRIGVTNSLTVGVHAEGDRSLVSGGPMVTARLGKLGDAEATFGYSRLRDGQTGRAAMLAWSYQRRSVSLSLSARASTGGFVSFGDPHPETTPRVEWSGSLSLPVWLVGVVSVNAQQQWLLANPPLSTGGWRRLAYVGGHRRITDRLQMQWRAGQTWTRSSRSVEASVGLVLSLGRTSASVSASRNGNVQSEDVMLTHPLPIDTGVGFRLRADRDGRQIDGAVQAQNHMARTEVQFFRLNGQTRPGVLLSGGVVAIGRSLSFTNGLGESYALVEVPGVKDVRVYANNTEVGRTGRDGKLLVPRMLPNYANRLAISDLDLPADRTVAEGEKLIAPPHRGGAVVVFRQEQLQAATGRIRWIDSDGERTPAFGILTVSANGRTVESPIAVDGTFFLEQLPAGRYMGLVNYRGDDCLITLTVPAHVGTVVDLGVLSCRPRQ